jgi:hypothetical protein
MQRNTPHSLLCLCLIASAFCITSSAQQLASANLPDAPDITSPSSIASSSLDGTVADTNQSAPQNASNSTPADHQDGQTKRILGIIPNFRAVSAGVSLPPQTVKQKFVTASQDSFDYSAVVVPAALAGFSLYRNSIPEFHGGAAGYGRYFWHSFTDQTIENYMVEFVVPSIHHEDTRFYTLGTGGFVKRASYALSRVVITRNDNGQKTFNAGEVIGAGAAAGISNLYYPQSQRTFGQTGQLWATNVGIDAATFVFKEFWPDINHALFHGQK